MKRLIRRIPTDGDIRRGVSQSGEDGSLTGAAFPVRNVSPKSIRPSRVVVDAAVVSRWFAPESYSEAARRIVGGGFEVFVPDLVFSELGGILERRVAANEMIDAEALSILQVLSRMPLQIHRTWPLGPIALELQRSLDRGMYDCIHIALALRESAVLVTADRALYETLNDTLLAPHVWWIADIPNC